MANRKYTTETFIEKSKEIHGDKYDYSLTEYNGMINRIKIICPEHGLFEQFTWHHLKGDNCKKCSLKSITSTKEIFVKKSSKKYNNKYDYSLVEYKNNHTKVKIICPEHGLFEQTPHNHLDNNIVGCPKCGKSERLTNIEFVKRANKIHGDKYDYSQVVYVNSHTKVKIFCKKCNKIFEQQAGNHIKDEQGCPKCKSSKGEKAIREWLIKNNIRFIEQKRFKECRSKRPLPFDFYLPDYNILIEFDGEQHFNPWHTIPNAVKKLEETQTKDRIKTKFCEDLGIKLVRINYKELKKIDVILKDNIKCTSILSKSRMENF